MSQFSLKDYQSLIEYQKIGNLAVQKAQEENRRLGIPNWYSIDDVIISDMQLQEIAKKQKLSIKS